MPTKTKRRTKIIPPCVNPWCGDGLSRKRIKGLCKRCYGKHSIRKWFTGAPPRDFCGNASEPAPTRFVPADSRKVDEMTRRAHAGESVFSVYDARRNLN